MGAQPPRVAKVELHHGSVGWEAPAIDVAGHPDDQQGRIELLRARLGERPGRRPFADRLDDRLLDADDDPGRTREAYGDRICRRLAEVKAEYDPDNAFHHTTQHPARLTPVSA